MARWREAPRFRRAPLGTRGYALDEVDAFVAMLMPALRAEPQAPPLSAADVGWVTFGKAPMGARGYDVADVDAFLDEAERELRARETDTPPPAPEPLGPVDVGALRLRIASADLPRSVLGRGYNVDEVDSFLRSVDDALTRHGWFAADEVRRASFSSVFRGYDVGAVDLLLDDLERGLRGRG